MKFVLGYVVFELVLVGIVLLSASWRRQIRKKRTATVAPSGFVQTQEIFADPTTGVSQSVWYDPATGERVYVRRQPDDLF